MEEQANNDIIQNLKNTAFWKRVLFMVIFAGVFYVAKFAIWAVVLFLIFFNLLTGGSNERATLFGRQISAYIYHIFLFLTCNTEERPFPFSSWPNPDSISLPQTPSEEPTDTATSPQPNGD